MFILLRDTEEKRLATPAPEGDLEAQALAFLKTLLKAGHLEFQD